MAKPIIKRTQRPLTFRSNTEGDVTINELNTLQGVNYKLSLRDIADQIEKSLGWVQQLTIILINRGLLERTGSKKKGEAYRLTLNGKQVLEAYGQYSTISG